jgi:hypothetical protein
VSLPGFFIFVYPFAHCTTSKIRKSGIFAVFSARHAAHAGGVVSLDFVRRYPADVGAVHLPKLIGNGFDCQVAVFYAPAA